MSKVNQRREPAIRQAVRREPAVVSEVAKRSACRLTILRKGAFCSHKDTTFPDSGFFVIPLPDTISKHLIPLNKVFINLQSKKDEALVGIANDEKGPIVGLTRKTWKPPSNPFNYEMLEKSPNDTIKAISFFLRLIGDEGKFHFSIFDPSNLILIFDQTVTVTQRLIQDQDGTQSADKEGWIKLWLPDLPKKRLLSLSKFAVAVDEIETSGKLEFCFSKDNRLIIGALISREKSGK